MRAIYRKRDSALHRQETEWRAEDDALVCAAPGAPERRLLWQEVSAVRLAYAPTRLKTFRSEFIVKARSGEQFAVDNASYAGLADFEDRSSDYAYFVLSAVDRVAALSPGANATIGSTAASYYGQLAFVLTTFILLAIVMLLVPMSYSWIVIAKLAVIAAGVPVLLRWIRRARPRPVRLEREAFASELKTEGLSVAP